MTVTSIERASWIAGGRWDWKSFDPSDDFPNGRTAIRIALKKPGTYQHILELDWADYPREDAEQLAAFVCANINRN